MPSPRIYLPVRDAYAMGDPPLPLGDPRAGEQHIEVDDERDRYLAAKKSAPAATAWSSDELRMRLQAQVTRWLQSTIDHEHPGLVGAADCLDSMVAALQEDLVVMHRDSEAMLPAQAKAVYANVSLPSGWCPACRLGQTFLAIHGPVPSDAGFGREARVQAAQSLFQGRAMVRFVWTLAPDDALDRRKCERGLHASTGASWKSAKSAFLRVERQVIAPLDQKTACFVIRVYTYALRMLGDELVGRVRSSLETMAPSVARYKGFAGNLEAIRAALPDE